MDQVILGSAVKALGDGVVGGYIVKFGTPDEHDIANDYFTKATNYDVDFAAKPSVALRYNHGFDETIGKKALGPGPAELSIDDVGVWAKGQLNIRDRYEAAIYRLAEAGKLGWSSGTASHLVERKALKNAAGIDVSEITHWPLGLDASLTPIPCDYRTGAVVGVDAIKSIGIEELITSLDSNDAIKAALEDGERKKNAVITIDNQRTHNAYVSGGGKLHLFPIPPGDRNAAKAALNDMHNPLSLTRDDKQAVHDRAVEVLGDEHNAEGWCSYCPDGGMKSVTGSTTQGENDMELKELETTVSGLVTAVAELKSLIEKNATAAPVENATAAPVVEVKAITIEDINAAVKNAFAELAKPQPRTQLGIPAGAARATKSAVDVDALIDPGDEASEALKSLTTKLAGLEVKAAAIADARKSGQKFTTEQNYQANVVVDALGKTRAQIQGLNKGIG